MDELLQTLLQEEQELQFPGFTEQTAWELGQALVDHAVRHTLPVTVDIMLGRKQVFHAARPGTSADQDAWIRRKVRVVYRFGHSSYYMGQLLKNKGKSIEQAYLIPESRYAPHGGSFPVLVRGTGLVGAVTASGLTQADDHRLVTQMIREYLSRQTTCTPIP